MTRVLLCAQNKEAVHSLHVLRRPLCAHNCGSMNFLQYEVMEALSRGPEGHSLNSTLLRSHRLDSLPPPTMRLPVVLVLLSEILVQNVPIATAPVVVFGNCKSFVPIRMQTITFRNLTKYCACNSK